MPSLSTIFVHAVHHISEIGEFSQDMAGLPVSAANMTPEQIAIIVTAAVTNFRQNNEQKKQDKELSTKELLRLSLEQYIASLDLDIANMEAGFKSQFGDAWLEQIALRVMDEDTIPLQQDGETIEEYRTRLKTTLIDEMLNPDGSIKDKYKDHPEYGQYAQWAQAVYNRDKAIELANDVRTNPNSPAIEYLEEQRNSELTLDTADELEGHDTQEAVLSVDDRTRDYSGQQEHSTNTASSFIHSTPQAS